MTAPLRVVINAQLDPDNAGGIAQVLIGLVHGFSRIDSADSYLFVCSERSAAWLSEFAGPGVRIEVNRRRSAPSRGCRVSDGFWESFDPHVLHFPYQAYTKTTVPTVFNPHDLQHVHLPEFFSDDERLRRDELYRVAANHASAVAVASRWVREDLVANLGIDREKIHVIPWGAPTDAYRTPDNTDLDTLRRDLGIRRPYAIYPAQSWPHKNHPRLLEAFKKVLDSENPDLDLVLTGCTTEHAGPLKQACTASGLNDRVHWTGRVPESDLLALLRGARMMIVPTLFEAASFPIYEAFANDLPVACSNVTSLPEQVGDAALLFDPLDPAQIAHCLARLARDADLRRELADRGRRRIRAFDWTRTAEAYARLYRIVRAVDETRERAGRTGVIA